MEVEVKPESGRKTLVTAIRLIAGFGILAFVLSGLPWNDRLQWTDAQGEVVDVPGVIEGDWKIEAIEFLPAKLPVLDANWPERLRSAQTNRQTVAVARGQGPESFDWKPGMPRAFREMDRGGLVQAMALFSAAMVLVVTRWWRLLSVAGCPTSWFNAFRLTFLGMFFNLVVPGLTGGDLVKGVVVAKENPTRRADALVSVVVDRLLGLTVLAALAMVVILFVGGAFTELRAPLLLLLGVAAVAIFLYANKKLRKTLGLSALVDRLPFGEKLRSLDRAGLLYLAHPFEVGVAVVLSLANHVLIVLGVFMLGRAFGVQVVNLTDYLVLTPVANIVSALPVAPGGWGLGEYAYKFLFEMIGASGAMGVAVSVTFRLCQLVFGLIGGAFLLLPGIKAEVREVAA